MELKPEIIERLKKLDEKYQAMGQNLTSYLDGLLYADYLTYWDYIHLDTLLSLQTPKTSIPDEKIFILYHQVTELYFKLCLIEFRSAAEKKDMTAAFLLEKVRRINRYFDALVTSFDIMVDGMEPAQFLKFRMSLLPASGFQSGQYRMIEICASDFERLLPDDATRQKFAGYITDSQIAEMYKSIYWKTGATELSSGKKTLTLQQFEEKYSEEFLRLAQEFRTGNLRALYRSLPDAQKQNEALKAALRELDVTVNVNWKLAHYKSAVRYLQKDPEDIAATGGTNWQKYLPPRFQRIVFYPELWKEDEVAEWGKAWVVKEVFGKKG
jgi:tryptophan 2,3-dioxygenase